MSFKEKFLKIKDNILDILFPNDIKCIFCDRDINKDNICEVCRELYSNKNNRCQKCDTPILEGNIVCDHCKKNKHHFEKAFCPFVYEGEVRRAILKFKDDGGKYFAKHFAKHIFERLQKEEIEFDIIVPVPSHKKSIKRRGYNPALVLAEELSLLSGKPVVEALEKTVMTKNQKLLDYKQRQTNLENSITLKDKKGVRNKKVLLVDDIITTCATIETCASLLQSATIVYACGVARRG